MQVPRRPIKIEFQGQSFVFQESTSSKCSGVHPVQNCFKCLAEKLGAQIKIGPALCNFLGEIKSGRTKQSETAAWKPDNKKPRLEPEIFQSK